jgi:hypothetical protein
MDTLLWQINRKPMPPKEYKEAVKALGMTRTGAGRWLGVSLRTSKRYVSGDSDIPMAVALLLRCCLANGFKPQVPAMSRKEFDYNIKPRPRPDGV